MAFEKRNWLARIGTGLNKFFIGDKDSQGKQTLTNAPDSVTQQGDVISADNLNDLEDRIDNAFVSVAQTINLICYHEVWENPDPTQEFAEQNITLSDVDGGDILIEYFQHMNDTTTAFARFKRHGYGVPFADGTINTTWLNSTDGLAGASRSFNGTNNPKVLHFSKADSYAGGTYDNLHSNDFVIPYKIYIGDNVLEA